MVYSTELGYDPELWEECPPPAHFLAFSAPTRMALAVVTVTGAALFFWMLRKSAARVEHETAKERKQSLIKELEVAHGDAAPDAKSAQRTLSKFVAEETARRSSSASRSPKRRNSKRPFTSDEQNALIDWQREVQQIAESRMRETERQRDDDTATTITESTYGMPTNAFENQSMLSEFGAKSAHESSRKPKARHLVTETPPSTPPDGVAPTTNETDLRRRMATDLRDKLLEAGVDIGDSQLEQLMRQNERRGANEPNAYGTRDEVQSDSRAKEPATVLDSASRTGKSSSSSDEGFVKIDNVYDTVGKGNSQFYHNDSESNNNGNEILLHVPPSPLSLNEWSDERSGGEYGSGSAGYGYGGNSFGAGGQRISVEVDDTTADDIEFVMKRGTAPAAATTTADKQEAFRANRPLPPLETSSAVLTSAQISPFSQQSSWVGVENLPRDNTPQTQPLQQQKSPRFAVGASGEAAIMDEQVLKLLQEYDDLSHLRSQQQPQRQKTRAEPPLTFGILPTAVENVEQILAERPFKDNRATSFMMASYPTEFEHQQEQKQGERVLSPDTLSDEKTPYDLLETQLEKFAKAPSRDHREQRRQLDSQQLVEAELYLKDVIDFADQQNLKRQQPQLQSQQPSAEQLSPANIARDATRSMASPESGGAFIMEEEMLESDKEQQQPQQQQFKKQEQQQKQQPKQLAQHQQVQSKTTIQPTPDTIVLQQPATTIAITAHKPTSAEPTSRLVKTNEVFERPEMVTFDDADDAITYAPEIQSEEIPPDQLSENENSLNLVENFLEYQEISFTKLPPIRTTAPHASRNNDNKVVAEEESGREKPEDENAPRRPIASTTVNSVQHYGTEFEQSHQKEAQFSAEPHVQALGSNNFGTPSKAEAQTEQHLRQKKPAPPALFSPAAESGTELLIQQEAARSQSAHLKKLPKFMRRNIGFYDDSDSTTTSTTTSKSMRKQSSLMSALGVTSTQEALLKLTSFDELSQAMRRAGLESTNLIFGIDYTASNKYQGERSFYGKSLHWISKDGLENPYQQVIKIMGRTLAPFSNGDTGIPVFGFGDLTTGDWSVFALNDENLSGCCKDLDEVLRVYNEMTPHVDLSGPTNFAPLIYRAISICQKVQDYHILVIIADGQVTNERATRKAIVHACQYPLSIIVVGVGDGPWDMMKVFDESLPKRPWDNFHFVEFHEIIKPSAYYEDSTTNNVSAAKELDFAVQSLLEVPDQYHHIRQMGLLPLRNNNDHKDNNNRNRNEQTGVVDDGSQTPLPPAATSDQ